MMKRKYFAHITGRNRMVAFFACLWMAGVTSLSRAEDVELAQSVQRLQAHVETLAGEIGNRSVKDPEAMVQTESYITDRLTNWGYTIELQECDPGDDANSEFIPHNIIATKPGTLEASQFIVGAHYDTAENPGADDNASGVAVMLELARTLKDTQNDITLKFIAFANEEPPFYDTDNMGSMIYARAAAAREDDIAGVIILDGVGYYPDDNDYAYIGYDSKSAPLAEKVHTLFTNYSDFSLSLTTPDEEGFDESDHRSFAKEDYQAIFIIGALADFEDHYHSATDTPDTLDYESMAQLLRGLVLVLTDMVE